MLLETAQLNSILQDECIFLNRHMNRIRPYLKEF